MAEITYQTASGRRYRATITGDRLTDIQEISPSTSGASPTPGGTGGMEKSTEGKPKETESPTEAPTTDNGPSTPRKPADRVFVEQLKAVLVNNRARKQLRHRQRGILDSRKLVQTQLDSTSVWRQHNRKDSQRNYSVLLLVDESGSMRDDKAQLSQDVTQEVAASLGLVDGVETAVIGFSGNRLTEHKRFDNSGVNSLDAIAEASGATYTANGKRINTLHRSDFQNADLVAIEYSLDYLRRHASPNSRLVFVMLSDGEPCSSPRSITVVTADMETEKFQSRLVGTVEDTSAIAPMHSLILKATDIKSFGLGMLEGGQQVPKHKVVNNLTDTRKELLAFLRGALQ